MKKYLAVFASAMILFTFLVGCTKAGPTKNTAQTSTQTSAQTKTTVADEGPLAASYKDYVTGTETGYFVAADNGEHTYLKEDHPLVQEVKATMKDFCSDSSDRDYRHDDGKKEYEWYTKEVVEQLLIKKDPETTLANLKKYQVIEKEVGSTVDGIMFSNTGKAAQVAFENKIRWESATPEFLTQNKVSLNTDYKMQGIAVLIKEANRWKVQGVTYSKPQPGR